MTDPSGIANAHSPWYPSSLRDMPAFEEEQKPCWPLAGHLDCHGKAEAVQ